MNEIYIFGAGGHAKVVAYTARLCGYQIAGFWEDTYENIGKGFCGSKIVALESIPEGSNVFIGFGNNRIRLQKGYELRKRFRIPSIIHPSAQIAENVRIGDGVFIAALSNIDPDCSIGDFAIINKLVNISHDATICEGVHICAGSILAGHVKIGSCSFIGIGSRIIEEKEVGENTIIGAGSVVIRNIASNVTAVGCPARII